MLTHPQVVATLTEEDLQRWRVWSARDDAIRANPRLYNRDELERHFMERLRMWGEFFERYNVERSPFVNVLATSGDIYYMNDQQEV